MLQLGPSLWNWWWLLISVQNISLVLHSIPVNLVRTSTTRTQRVTNGLDHRRGRKCIVGWLITDHLVRTFTRPILKLVTSCINDNWWTYCDMAAITCLVGDAGMGGGWTPQYHCCGWMSNWMGYKNHIWCRRCTLLGCLTIVQILETVHMQWSVYSNAIINKNGDHEYWNPRRLLRW